MTNAISSITAEQTHAVVAQIMALTQQKLSADIAQQLVESAVQTVNAPQDPSTVTAQQLQSPIDISV